MARIDLGDPSAVDNREHHPRRNNVRAMAVTGLIVMCFVAWLAIQIPKGILTNTDELLTAERSRGDASDHTVGGSF
jgi:hypothetical protein